MSTIPNSRSLSARKGQNVRLAAKLIGWKVDIKSEEEKRQEVESQMEALVTHESPLHTLLGYGLEAAVEQTLTAAGVTTVEKLGEMTPEQLLEIPGIDAGSVERIQTAVISFYGQFDDGEPQEGDPTAETTPDEQLDSNEAMEAADPSGLGLVEEEEAVIESANIEAPESLSESVNGDPGEGEGKGGRNA